MEEDKIKLDEQSYYGFKEDEYRYCSAIETLEKEVINHKSDIKYLKNRIYDKKNEIRELKKRLKLYQKEIKEFENGFIFDDQLSLKDRYYGYLYKEAELHFIKYINEKNMSSFRTAKLYYQIIIDRSYSETEQIKKIKTKLNELNTLFESEINK